MYDEHFSRFSEQNIKERVDALIQRGTLGGVDDARLMQELNVRLRNGYKPKKIEHWHPYGFSQHPHQGAEVLALAPGGDMDHLIIVASADRRYRMKVAEGEVALHDDQGQSVHIKRGGIEIKSTKPVTIDAPTINLKGNVTLDGNLSQTGVHTDANGTHFAMGGG